MMGKRVQQGCIALATAFLLSMIIMCVSIPRIDPYNWPQKLDHLLW
jgi:hypothetical protein